MYTHILSCTHSSTLPVIEVAPVTPTIALLAASAPHLTARGARPWQQPPRTSPPGYAHASTIHAAARRRHKRQVQVQVQRQTMTLLARHARATLSSTSSSHTSPSMAAYMSSNTSPSSRTLHSPIHSSNNEKSSSGSAQQRRRRTDSSRQFEVEASAALVALVVAVL